tara:strand:- start:195 stop:851 length:657 start_codon:yes stop_codon:yes gene_type:complete
MSWIDEIINAVTSNAGGIIDTVAPLAVTAGINTFFPDAMEAQREMAGFQGEIPNYSASRQRVPNTYDPLRRSGSSGQRYFTDMQYVPKGSGNPLQTDAAGLAALNRANPAREDTRALIGPPLNQMAAGGIASMKKGRYLDGDTDGMADKVKASIDGEQEARLSDGEFIVPADVVAHIGNGNSEAGAKQLFSMMDRIRKARTGNEKQGKKINPKDFLPV